MVLHSTIKQNDNVKETQSVTMILKTTREQLHLQKKKWKKNYVKF